ncbi:MAG: class II aldolase/adducin family protein [Deferribacteraceae bacterium]|jgi:L-fuculose-phosphate aldolase|nr:class II aldolase/adducin family protein [Deferribacteraceae bacterium]
MSKIRAEICEAGRRLYAKNLIAAAEGNISVRGKNGNIWITPSGVCKGYMTPDMLTKVSMDGNIICGRNKPSSEIKMHLRVYQLREDAKAVVHAHPVTATALASAGIALDKAYLTENVLSLGIVPVAPFAMPSTDETPDSVTPFVCSHNAILLANHGVLCIGKTLTEAVFLAEHTEAAAKTAFIMKLLGAEDKVIPLEKVEQMSRNFNLY